MAIEIVVEKTNDETYIASLCIVIGIIISHYKDPY